MSEQIRYVGKRTVVMLPIDRLVRYDVDSIISKIRNVMQSDYFDRSLASQPTELQKKSTIVETDQITRIIL